MGIKSREFYMAGWGYGRRISRAQLFSDVTSSNNESTIPCVKHFSFYCEKIMQEILFHKTTEMKTLVAVDSQC